VSDTTKAGLKTKRSFPKKSVIAVGIQWMADDDEAVCPGKEEIGDMVK
jgi:hypothetical protein